jgi:hypothetical protein
MPHMMENNMSGEIHTGDTASTQRNFAPNAPGVQSCSGVGYSCQRGTEHRAAYPDAFAKGYGI